MLAAAEEQRAGRRHSCVKQTHHLAVCVVVLAASASAKFRKRSRVRGRSMRVSVLCPPLPSFAFLVRHPFFTPV